MYKWVSRCRETIEGDREACDRSWKAWRSYGEDGEVSRGIDRRRRVNSGDIRFPGDGLDSSIRISFKSWKFGWSIVMSWLEATCRRPGRRSSSIGEGVHVHKHDRVHLGIWVWRRNSFLGFYIGKIEFLLEASGTWVRLEGYFGFLSVLLVLVMSRL